MTAELVTLVLDRYSGAQKPYVRGGGTLAPSLEFPDPADRMLIGQAPVPFSFRAGSLPAVEIIANDTAGPQQEDGTPGWTWDIAYDPSTPGSPGPASYYVLSTNGATQYLSGLASVPAAQPGQQYVPLLGGVALGGPIAPRDVVLADAATVTPLPLLGNDFTLLLTSAVGSTRAIAAAVPLADCQNITLLLVQPPSGGPCGVTWASGADGYDFGSASPPQLSTTPGQADLAAFKSRIIGGTRKWRYLGSQGGYS